MLSTLYHETNWKNSLRLNFAPQGIYRYSKGYLKSVGPLRRNWNLEETGIVHQI